MDSAASGKAPANDAHLVQNVRSVLGRSGFSSGLNVSSCGFVITLHGAARNEAERRGVEEMVRGVEGVRGVVNRLAITAAPGGERCFPSAEDG